MFLAAKLYYYLIEENGQSSEIFLSVYPNGVSHNVHKADSTVWPVAKVPGATNPGPETHQRATGT